MQKPYVLALLASAILGVSGGNAAHAQSKSRAIAIVEIFENDHQAFLKEFAPLARKALETHGARYLSRGGDVTSIEASEAPTRLTVIEFDSIEKAKQAFASTEYKDARAIGDKYAKFRILAIEEVDQ
jgi:uncharacterized protein (DUF1330 family)